MSSGAGAWGCVAAYGGDAALHCKTQRNAPLPGHPSTCHALISLFRHAEPCHANEWTSLATPTTTNA